MGDGAGPGLRAVPRPQGAAEPARRHDVRRRAADAGDRPGPHGEPEAPLHGRAIDGTVARVCRAGVRHHQDDQPAGDDGVRGRAERQHGACPSPTGATCSRWARWSSPARPRSCSRTRSSRRRIWGRPDGLVGAGPSPAGIARSRGSGPERELRVCAASETCPSPAAAIVSERCSWVPAVARLASEPGRRRERIPVR